MAPPRLTLAKARTNGDAISVFILCAQAKTVQTVYSNLAILATLNLQTGTTDELAAYAADFETVWNCEAW